ncbi:MAG: TolC family protein, partial [Mariprofundaceae bacterium]|nr:TolC family protein [Mariprofundaceae bacterium]
YNKCFMVITIICICSPNIAIAHGLGVLLHQVEKEAPQFHIAIAKQAATAAGTQVAKSQYWGHAEIFAQTTHYNTNRLVSPISFPATLTQSSFDQNTYGYGTAFTLPIDIDGRITAKVHAQEHLNQAATENINQTRLSIFSQTVTMYRGLQQLEGIKKSLHKQLAALKGHKKVTEISVRVGRVAAVELLRIEAEIKSVQGQLAGLMGDEARLRANLGALINTTSFNQPIDTLNGSPPHMPAKQKDDDVLHSRPDLLAASSITQAEGENLKSAQREWLPSLSIRAEALRTQGYTANGKNNWSVTGQMSWQFWDGNRRFAHTDQAQANQEIARQQFQNTLNQARAELQSAKAAWQASLLQYQATTAGLKASEKTERIQSDRFASGRISAVDLIDAEAALARARADRTTALAKWWLADDQYHLAQGDAPTAYLRANTKNSTAHSKGNHHGK